VSGSPRISKFFAAGLLLLNIPLAAQLKVGLLSSDLSGTIAPGYSADYGNMTGSDHSWALGGTANYSGSYYNPGFLSFNAGFYLNQSRANSSFQSISNASGFNLSSTVFGGSRFPGSINYSKAFNSEGNYSVPGLANYVTHGNSDTFGVNWSENLPDVPSLSAGFQMGSGQYSVYGANDQGENTFRSLNLHSGYRYAGFNMGAYYTAGSGHDLIPEVVTGQEEPETHSTSDAYGLNVEHGLPLHGSISGGANRSSWETDAAGTTSTGSVDLLNALASIHPIPKITFTASANYSDNLTGQLIQSIVSAGGATTGINSNEPSDSLDLQAIASGAPAKMLQTSVFVERRAQNFLGVSYGVNSYGASATYSRLLLNGNFNAALTVEENSADGTGEDTLGFSTTENYSNEIDGWKVTGSFGYAQNVQTLLVTYMNSYYNYSANARRRWGQFNVSMGAGAARTALTQQAGTASDSQSYNGSVGYGSYISATGSYSKASGQALATGSGLVPVPIPSPIVPSSLVSLFGGTSYSFGLTSAPAKKLLLTAAYAKSSSNTSSGGIFSANEDNQFNAIVQYQVRKLGFTSGFARLEQGFSQSGSVPEVVSSYYIGVSRWFNFF
jgi:hypothetical protein